MNPDEYIRERLDDQINYYHRKSSNNKFLFRGISTVQIISASAIPIIVGCMEVNHIKAFIFLKTAVAVLGGVIAVLTGIMGIFKFQENWVEFRTTCQALKKEKYMFLSKVEPYHCDDAFSLLVQRVELLLSKENANWAQSMMKSETKNSGCT